MQLCLQNFGAQTMNLESEHLTHLHKKNNFCGMQYTKEYNAFNLKSGNNVDKLLTIQSFNGGKKCLLRHTAPYQIIKLEVG
jgi:hypothetical protein